MNTDDAKNGHSCISSGRWFDCFFKLQRKLENE